jgi:predicted O-methyltransferase YrrM
MLTLFSAMGLIEKKDGAFRVTEIAREFLVYDSQWFVGPYFVHFANRPIYRSLLETLRTGKPAGWAGARARKAWAEEMENAEFARLFTGTMDSRGIYVGPALARTLDLKNYHQLLDVAGGSGIYACCIAAAQPHLKVTVLEKSPVDRVARECIERRGLAGRVTVVSGDMFLDSLPPGCDAHLWSNALHDWDTPEVKKLLQKSFAALPPGGLLVIHDKHLNREKTGPLTVAAHSVFLMAGTEGKFYSIGEMETLLSEVGFENLTYAETVADYSIITARKPVRRSPSVRLNHDGDNDAGPLDGKTPRHRLALCTYRAAALTGFCDFRTVATSARPSSKSSTRSSAFSQPGESRSKESERPS